MPRQAHGRSLLENGPAKTRKRKSAKLRGLNALETAERQFPDQIKTPRHRLGEAEDDDDKQNTRGDAGERSAKRRKVDNAMDEADSADEGSDPDGNPWHVGVEEDDDDSEIDSDEAFGESDEERFADFTFRGSENVKDKKLAPKRKSSKTKNLDLDEDDASDHDAGHIEEEDEDDLGEDAIDLAAAWDLDDEEEREEQKRAARKQAGKKRGKSPSPSIGSSDISTDSASEEQTSEEEGEYQGFSVSEDEGDDETTARLRNFVDGLTPAQQEAKPVRRELSRNLPDKPSQFGLPSAGLSAADLAQYIKDPAQRQSLKILQAAEREEPSHYKGGVPGKLAAPLAKRQQDRLDRAAAYDQSKQTMDRWTDTVKQNRRAEHISFPLIDHTKASASNVKTLQPISKTQPQSELESKIQEIMLESGLNTGTAKTDEDQEQQYEQLQEKNIPLEEVQARRQELRMQRELMFREEVRAKRIKKIKSKAFRRVHRRERDKFAVQERERLAAAGVINSDEEREQNDRRRAEERMGARHRESRWAKAAKATGQTTWNNDAKSGVSELARRDEELRRRVEGKHVRGSDESGSESDSEYSDSEEEDDKWNERLEQLKEVPQPNGKSKLADMAFMKKAEAERKTQNDEELRRLRRSMNGGDDADSEHDSNMDDAPTRQRFGNNSAKQVKPSVMPIVRNEFEERLSEDEDNAELVETPELKQAVTKLAGPGVQKSNGHVSSTKPQTKVQVSRPQAQSTVLAKPSHSKTGTSSKNGKSQQSALDDYTSPSESEEEQNDGLDDKDKLALDIFAGDDEEDLRKQFEKEKREIIKEEGDQVIDNTLPGWGNWTGAGVSKREQNKAKGRFLTTVKGVAPESRKDAKLHRVIVNEKRVKKNGKYLATELPHPFESRQQYERSLRLPVGPEWSTRNHFQDAIKPRVLLKQGHVISPMVKPTA